MVRYATELNIKGTTYTIKDLEAHKALGTKADLVDGKISKNQLPYTPVSTDDIIDLNKNLATKADKDKLATVAFSGSYGDLLDIPDTTITVDRVNELIETATKDFATKVEVTDAIKDFATKVEVANATKDLATKVEVTNATKDLATKV